MKKILYCTLALAVFLALSGCAATANTETEPAAKTSGVAQNFTDEMKIPYATDISPEDGADSVERQGDHKASPYFTGLDYYNMESTDTLTILPQFKTIQQTSEWSCGVAAALMVLNYYDKLGDYNEQTLADLRSDHSDKHPGTCLTQVMDIFDAVGGFTYATTYDYLDKMDEINLELIQDYLKEGVPVLIAWNDWGGHWQAIIGYDTMGTETESDDVLIAADPYDTTDHNQDGYGVYPAERFIYNFTMYNFFPEDELNDRLFLAAKLAG